MIELNRLSEIYNSYDTFIIDLWGVMHDGIKAYSKALETVDNLKKNKKKIVFLSNAPRPSAEVKKFLKNLNIEEKYLENIVTSGEASMQALKEKRYGNFFYHLGPERDSKLFFNIKENKTSLEKSNFILCTGLFDHQENNLSYYENLLKKHVSKKFVCTNPDLVVHRGKKKEFCAGTIAKIFESIGGNVIYFGKPYKEIYKMCFNEGEKVIAIGDNLNTDIKGANNMNIDNILILGGIHQSEHKNNNDQLLDLTKKYNVRVDYFQKELSW